MVNNQSAQETLIVVGNGMVGYKFCERLLAYDTERQFNIVVFGEEPRPAYDRVQLTAYFTDQTVDDLTLAPRSWYEENGITLCTGEHITRIDRSTRTVVTAAGAEFSYDKLVLATGSAAFVPPIPGVEKDNVYVYRTIEDLDDIMEAAKTCNSAAVIGGGLLGLEAAKACKDMNLSTHVVEFAPRLMARQLDDEGAGLLQRSIEAMGVQVHTNKNTREIEGNGKVESMQFHDGSHLDVDMIVVSAGIKPRDELAREAGLEVGTRGGIVVDDTLSTEDENIFVVGEAALHDGMIYGLVAPGYEMAEVVAANLFGEGKRFEGADMSTKLKLLGVDVASLGDPFVDPELSRTIAIHDEHNQVYKKLVVSEEGEILLGAILVGNVDEYATLLRLVKAGQPLPVSPETLILGTNDGETLDMGEMPDEEQVCSCNMITKGMLCGAIREQNLLDLDSVKSVTKAGTGCGGCMPLVTDLFKQELARAGVEVNNNLCEHFAFTRQELFDIVRIKELKSFGDVMADCGTGLGCEICKPCIASIIASLWNEHIVEHDGIQDTNDRFLANIQRQGLYSVVPRVPGGEILPDQLICLGVVAKKYNLYSKITGGQRVDLFGARVNQLPDIWEELIEAGFESGHAYGKSLRTVKSCVGDTWCRYGVQDSVSFAVKVENRYKGVRSPHKLKSAVSGCTRECAEAQSKDFGMIATDKGWNLYVCGNGGTKPRHGDLIAVDIDEDTLIRYLDRFIMFYIYTADKLTRTSVWIEKLEGGIEYLKQVIIDDKLGICEQLESDMKRLIDTYKCEWTEVVNNPEKRKKFTHFANSPEADSTVSMTDMREQERPGDWSNFDGNAETVSRNEDWMGHAEKKWVNVANRSDFPHDGGITIQYGKHQIAVYNFASQSRWYACQNMCPHKRDMVLSRGIIGDKDGIPKVACPLHKKTFNLCTGEGMSDPEYRVQTFEVAVKGDAIFLLLPEEEILDRLDLMNPERSSCMSCG